MLEIADFQAHNVPQNYTLFYIGATYAISFLIFLHIYTIAAYCAVAGVMSATTYSEQVPMRNFPPQRPMPEET
jgi:hypothetical protein